MFKHIFIITFNLVFFISGLALGNCTDPNATECNITDAPTEKKEPEPIKTTSLKYLECDGKTVAITEEVNYFNPPVPEDLPGENNNNNESPKEPISSKRDGCPEEKKSWFKRQWVKVKNSVSDAKDNIKDALHSADPMPENPEMKTTIDEYYKNSILISNAIATMTEISENKYLTEVKKRITPPEQNLTISGGNKLRGYINLYELDPKKEIENFINKDFNSNILDLSRLLKKANVFAVKGCIESSYAAQYYCDKNTNPKSKKANKLMKNVESAIGGMSTTQGFGMLKVAAAGAHDLMKRAQIRCGNEIDIAESTCEKAIKKFDKLISTKDDATNTIAKFHNSLNQILDAYSKKFNEAKSKCDNMGSVDCYKAEEYIRKIDEIKLIQSQFINDINNNLNLLVENAAKSKELLNGLLTKLTSMDQSYAEQGQLASALMQAGTQAAMAQTQTSAQGAGANGSVVNTQMNVCSDPSSLQCKCYQNANAEGCPGAVVNNFVKSLTPGGGNQMAAVSTGGIQKPNLDLGKTTLGGTNDGSSSGSTATLGGNNNSGIDSKATGFQAAVAGSAGGGGGGTGSTNTDKNQKVDPAAEASYMGSNYKFNASGYNKGSTFGGKAQLSGQKYSDMQKKLERQIASQQYKSEVSESSGTSNWDKVKNRYIQMKSSFVGQ